MEETGKKFITAGEVTRTMENIPVNATGGIPSNKLNEILSSEAYMKTLQPLIAEAVKQASSIEGLGDAITKLFKDTKNKALIDALTALQKKLQSIYENTKGANEENPIEANEENPNPVMDRITAVGGGRRRTKNAYFYNKRRKTRRRKGKK